MMKITTEDIKEFLEKKLRITTNRGYIYTGMIMSVGEDYIKFKDKYEQVHFIAPDHIAQITEVQS